MSNSVESKVVEMKFDNKDFEANVKTSMSTLDKLKEKLNFKGAADGLSNIQKASDKIDFSGMSNGIDVASVKFSALQVAGVTAITNITNSLLGLGQNIIQTFAVQPKMDGFNEYELKMGSIQTIMASTGASLDEVNGYLDELNTYADKTIYSFADMTANIGKFTNAGVDLNTAVKAIQGISNEAAVSGANANEASRAMYNFAQAISAGSVKLIDWKSIELANMGTVEFKNELIKTGVELGTLVEQEGKYISTTTDANGHVSEAFTATTMFNDSLSAQWMTTDVLTKTLAKYSDETTELGKKAFASAQDVKTFSMMMDTLKEAAGSGWTTTWELIFGDFEQAKTFWTGLTNAFGGIIQTIADTRNNFIKAVMGGGNSFGEVKSRIESAGISLDDFQSKLIEVGNQQGIATEEIINNAGSMEAAFQSGQLSGQLIIDTLKAIADGAEVATESQVDYTSKLEEFQKVVDDVWNGSYYNGEERIQALTDAGYDYYKVQDLVNKTVDGHRLTLEDLNEEQLKSVGYTQEEVDALHALANEAAESGTSLNSLLADLTKMSGRDLFTKSITNSVTAITNIFNTIKAAWSGIFTQDEAVANVRSVLEVIYGLSNRFLTWSTDKADELTRVLNGIFSVLKLISDYAGGAVKFALKTLGKAISGTDLHILDMAASAGDALVAFTEWIRANETLNDWIAKIQDGVTWFVDKLVELKNKVTDFISNFSGFESVSDLLNQAKDSMKNLGTGTYKFQSLTSKASSALDRFKSNLKQAASGHDILNAALELGSKAWDELKEKTSKWFETIKQVKDEVKPMEKLVEAGKKSIESLGDAFIKAGDDAEAGRRTVAQACSDMTQNMIQGVGDALGVASISDVFNKVVEKVKEIGQKFTDTFTGIKKDASDAGAGIGDALSNINWGPLVAILGSAGILYTLNNATKALQQFAGTLKTFTKVNDAIAGFITQGTTLLKNFDKVLQGIKFKQYADGILRLAIAIGVLAVSFIALGSMDADSVKQAIIGLASIVAAMSILMAVSGFGKTEVSTALFGTMAAMFVALAVVFVSMSYAMKQMSGIDAGGMISAITGLAGIIVAIGVLGKVAGKVSKEGGAKQLLAFAAMMMAFGVALKLMGSAIKSMGSIDPTVMDQGLHTVGTLTVYLAALMALTYKANPASLASIGSMAVALSGALVLVIAAIKLAGTMPEDEITQGLIVIGVLGAFLAAIVKVISKQGTTIIQMSGTILAMAVSIGILVGVAKLAGKLSEDDFKKGAKAIAVFGSICSALMIAISRLGGEKGVARASTSLLAMSFALGALVAVCYLCSLLDDEGLNRGLRAVAVLGAMVSLMTYSLKGAQEANKSIIAMTAVVVALVAAVTWLGMMDPDALARGTASMAALMLCFSLMMKALKVIEKGQFGGTLGILVMLAAVAVALSGILYMISGLDSESALPNALALSSLMIAFAAALKIMGSMKGDIGASRSSIAVMVLVTVALASVLGLMSSMGIQNGISNAVALSILLIAFSAAMRIMGGINSVSGSALAAMVVLGAICAELGGVLGLMTAMNVQNGIANAIALGIFANALSVSCVILGTVKAVSGSAIIAMAALSVICAILAGVLAMMTALNVQEAMANALAISELVLALSAACVLLADAGAFGPAGIIGVGVLLALIVAVGGLMVAIGALNSYVPEMEECLNSAIPILASIGEGLGQMVGNFVGGTLESFSSHLPGIATNLSDFIANLDPFMSKVESIGGKDFSGVQQLAVAIMALSAAELLNGMSSISEFFTGDDIKTTLNDYADAIGEFCDKAAEFNTDGASKGAAVAPMIAQIMESMPEEGGLKSSIFGSKSNTMKNLKTNLGGFADAVVDFANTMAGVDTSNVANGVEAGKKIGELMGADMPTSGGLAGMIFGDTNNTLDGLKDKLGPLADAVVDFASKTAGIDTSGIDPAKTAIQGIAQMLNDGDVQNGLNFYVDTESIKNRFNGLGEAISNFSTHTAGGDFGSTGAAVSAMSQVAQFINNDLAEFNGGNVEGFVTAINQLGEANVAALVAAFQNGAGQMTQAGMNLMSALAMGISSGAGQASSAVTIVTATLQMTAQSASSLFLPIGLTYMNMMSNGVRSGQGIVMSAGQLVVMALTMALRTRSAEFVSIGQEYMQNLANGIRNGIGAARSAAQSALDGVASSLRSYRSGFYSAGAYCIAGLAEGIRAGRSTAIAAASDVAAASLEAANAKLGVASPSKEFMKTGKWSVIGLANGIRDYTYVAADAGKSLAKTVMDTTSDSFTLLNALPNTDFGFANLTPVIDYSGITKYSGTLDLSASLGKVISEPMKNTFDVLEETQKAITNSNNQVLDSINGLRNDMSSYNDSISNMENAMYIDGKKMASSIAKPMNRELGILTKRGRL